MWFGASTAWVSGFNGLYCMWHYCTCCARVRSHREFTITLSWSTQPIIVLLFRNRFTPRWAPADVTTSTSHTFNRPRHRPTATYTRIQKWDMSRLSRCVRMCRRGKQTAQRTCGCHHTKHTHTLLSFHAAIMTLKTSKHHLRGEHMIYRLRTLEPRGVRTHRTHTHTHTHIHTFFVRRWANSLKIYLYYNRAYLIIWIIIVIINANFRILYIHPLGGIICEFTRVRVGVLLAEILKIFFFYKKKKPFSYKLYYYKKKHFL